MTKRYLFDARVIQDHFPGIARYAYNLLAAMLDALHDDESLCVLHDPTAQNTRFDWLRLRHPRLTLIAHIAPVFHPMTLLRTPPTAGGSAAQHYPYYVRPYFGASRRASLTTIHDLIPLLQQEFAASAKDQLLARVLIGLAVRASAIVITVSEASARDLRRFWPRARLVVIPEAADPIFTPQPPERCAAVRIKYNLPERFTLYLASNKPHKNLVRLVEAWAMLSAQLPESQPEVLVIAGHYDPRYPQAQARAAALGMTAQVRFIGEVSNADLPSLYSACSLFVFPSLYEGFGLTPLEAMACGAPVACSNASSLPEVVGDAALLFDPTRPAEIAATCARALADPALRAELRARSLAQAARFTWSDAARRTLAAYREASRIASTPSPSVQQRAPLG